MRKKLRIWKRRRVLALAMVAAAAVPSAAAAGVHVSGVDMTGYPSIRFSVVTSSPSATRPVVTENGRAVAALDVQNLARAKSVSLLIDRSQSMKGGALTDATAAALAFVRAKAPGDRVQVIAFGSKAVVMTGFTASPVDAQQALRSLSVDPKQGTALYDAIDLGSRSLNDEVSPGRVLIVLTDGRDVSSADSLADAVASARHAGVVVYPVAIESPGFSATALRNLAESTGGSYHSASSSTTLPAVYAGIASELARTWRVSYLTAARPGDQVRLQARVPGSGSASATVGLSGSLYTSVPARPSRLLPSVLYEGPGTLLVALAVALLVLLAAGFFLASREGMWLTRRLQPHIAGVAKDVKRRRRDEKMAGVRRLLRATEETFGHLRQWRAVARLLERADLPLKPAEFLYMAVGAGVLLAFFAGLTAGGAFTVFIGLVVGASLPFAFVQFMAAKRLRAFENQLPDLLITIAASLKAGHSFRQGIQSVVEEGAQPAAKEFKRVLTETRLGRPMDDALNEMSERVGSKNLEFVMSAVTIQRQVGGSLAGLFDMVAEAVRQRQQFSRKIRGLTAMGRMSAYVLVGLPFFVALALTLLNREYMSPLYTTSTGHKLIAIGIGMMAFGSVVLKKIVSFKG